MSPPIAFCLVRTHSHRRPTSTSRLTPLQFLKSTHPDLFANTTVTTSQSTSIPVTPSRFVPDDPSKAPAAQWRCCLCHAVTSITRDLSLPAETHPFHPARCRRCEEPPCAACSLFRPVVEDNRNRHHHMSGGRRASERENEQDDDVFSLPKPFTPARLVEWNPRAGVDAVGFVCLWCGAPTMVSAARWRVREAARWVWGAPVRAAETGVAASEGEERVRHCERARVVGTALLPFERRRKRTAAEMLGLLPCCASETCGQAMCDESLVFYVPVDQEEVDAGGSRWGDWAVVAAAAQVAGWWVMLR